MTSKTLSRRTVILSAAALTIAPVRALHADPLPRLEVEKTPNCGCCSIWVDYAREAGFDVTVTDTYDYVGMKTAAGVPQPLWSCHTARIDGYVVEGHVPFAAIRTLLRDRPDIAGISVPEMPAGSPGMGGGVDAVVPVTAWGGVAGDGAPFPFDG